MAAPGPKENQDAPHPHQAVLDPTGAFIVVPDLGADILRIYSVNKKTGFLTSCNNVTVAAGSGPRHAGFWNPTAGTDRTKLFLGNELSKSASAFSVSYPQEEGGCLTLELTQTGKPYPPSPPAKASQDVEAVMVKVQNSS
jgi:6-phosphogluconolactonase (cycloisomerase 2 family)